jgi:competence protein ComEC
LSQLPFAQFYRPDPPDWAWLAAILGVVVSLLPKGLPGRSLGLLLLMPILMLPPNRPQQGALALTLLDVGQGLSCVIETARHVLVYDTGPAYRSGFNAADAVLLPYLHSRGIGKIDRLVVSNGDRDHAGGLETLLKQMDISHILAGEPQSLAGARQCETGQSWRWDGVDFRILHPQSGDSFRKSNDLSCVLKVTSGGRSVLISGDVERTAERLLVERQGEGLRADILVAPHHGSKTSSSDAFVARVRPQYVLFAVGYRNRFGFPHPSVVERWRQGGALLLDTAESGAIQFRLEADGRLNPPQRSRIYQRRYWSTP